MTATPAQPQPVSAPPPGRITLKVIRFAPNLPPGTAPLRQFADPSRHYAYLEFERLDQVPADAPAAPAPTDRFEFLFLPGGSATPYELQKQAEAWMAPGPDGEPPLEVVMRSDRVLWRPGRGLMHGAPDRMDETLLALADFAYHEGQLRRLEGELEAHFETASGDIPLTTGSVTAADLARRGHVHEMTCLVTRMRLEISRLEKSLEHASATLPGAGRRLAAEFLTQALAIDRRRWVDDRLEVYEDLYELANDRLSEYRYFRKEALLELGVIGILIVETVVVIWEILQNI